jgi:hypothetical protein
MACNLFSLHFSGHSSHVCRDTGSLGSHAHSCSRCSEYCSPIDDGTQLATIGIADRTAHCATQPSTDGVADTAADSEPDHGGPDTDTFDPCAHEATDGISDHAGTDIHSDARTEVPCSRGGGAMQCRWRWDGGGWVAGGQEWGQGEGGFRLLRAGPLLPDVLLVWPEWR